MSHNARKESRRYLSSFQHYTAERDSDSVLSLYDPEAVFQSTEITNGRHGLRKELAPLAAIKARSDFDIRQVIQTGGIAELQLFRKDADVGRMSRSRPNKHRRDPSARLKRNVVRLLGCSTRSIAILRAAA